ncbi:TetR/AcrR family transcriptional regulator [Reyranella sp.]|uniref:TetR/AcrR family transcriptional regulator n=1 Tax=Reyranella sp. TaxID=1929291 RepID=UPI003D0E8CE3
MPSSSLKPPQQERSRKGEKALLQAGLKGIETRGVAGLNMADVAAEAKASIGSLYFRFGDKSQFVEAVLAVALKEFQDRGFALCETAEREKWPQRRILEGWVAVVVTSVRERRSLVRELISHMATRPDAWKPIHERRRQLEDRLLSVLSARSSSGRNPAREMRLRIGLQVVAATVINMVVVDPGPLRINDPSAKDALCDLLFSFIGAPTTNAKGKAAPQHKAVRSKKA